MACGLGAGEERQFVTDGASAVTLSYCYFPSKGRGKPPPPRQKRAQHRASGSFRGSCSRLPCPHPQWHSWHIVWGAERAIVRLQLSCRFPLGSSPGMGHSRLLWEEDVSVRAWFLGRRGLQPARGLLAKPVVHPIREGRGL